MALDNVPWLLEQVGVAHPSSAARALAWAATGGQRGVIGPTSLGVVAQNVPNGTVQVRPGGAVLPSNYSGGAQESYIARNRTATNVAIRATGSSGKRSDAVILRIDDTGKAGQAPSNIQAYDYTKLAVIEGVSGSLSDTDSLGLAYPAILLARIDIPASTGTITSAMIKDMRHIAMARSEDVIQIRPMIQADSVGNDLVLTGTDLYPDGEWWPNTGGRDNNGIWYIDVPKWATRAQIRAEWLSVYTPTKSGQGQVWVTYGPGAGSPTPTYYTQAFGWDADESASGYRQNLIATQDVSIPAAMRGSVQPFVLRGNRGNDSSKPGRIRLDWISGVTLSVRFLERPDTDLQAD